MFSGSLSLRGWERIVIGEEGEPQGVCSAGCEYGSDAMGVNEGRDWRPVPPIMAMWRGP